MAQLNIQLLGTLQITLDGNPLTGFATDKARALLAYLALENAHPLRRDALATLLWPDQPENKARQNLRQTLLYLRQTLKEDDQCPFLLIDRETVQLNPASDYRVDVAEFQALHTTCRGHRHRRTERCLPCMRRLERMTELYHGEFLANFYVSDSALFEEWATLKREWLHREAIEALFILTDYYTRRGELTRARQCARRQVELEPWREEAHRQLMHLLAMEGQRSAALAQYETCRRILAQELGVEPMAETTALVETIKREEVQAQPRDHGLPPSPTRFVGRETELAELAEWLAATDCRLVTLVGAGGIGKSRLALQVLEEHRGLFAHGVAFVPLDAVASAEFIAYAIARVLGFSMQGPQSPDEQLLNYLREKEVLLALDNFEHLLQDCALIEQILTHAPEVTLLITSRERLNLREEHVYHLEGLAYPTTDSPGPDVERYSAVALFAQCAQRADRRFMLDASTLPDVLRICRLVEGIPLGLELAAAWVDSRACSDIAQEIAANSDMLTTSLRNVDPRHRSLRASFEYSWKLLTDPERACLARLAVFQGGFDRAAAVQVAAATPDLLAGLIHKSLLRTDASGRYTLHPLLHQYIAEKLDATGEATTVYAEHARYYATFLEQREAHLKGAAQKQTLSEITLESDNVRRAWEWAVSQGQARAVEQALESLYHFCDIRCWFQAGVALLAPAIERWSAEPEQQRLLGKLLARQGALYHHQGLYQQAAGVLERSLRIFESLEMPSEQIFCLVNLANAIRHQGQNDKAEQLAHNALALSKQIGDRRGMAQSLHLLGLLRYWSGDLDRTEALLEESLALARELGDQRLIMAPLNALGDAACHRGDYAKARQMFEECLALSRDLDDQFNVAIHLNNLGTVYHMLEQYPEARTFYQESLEICRQIGDQNGQAIALSNLGEIAYTLGDYQKATQYYREGLAIGRALQEPWIIMTCLNNLGEIACAHNDCQEAQAYLTEALQIAQETQTLTLATKILMNLARLFAQQGLRSQAAALLDLVRRHPASESDTQEKAGRLLDELGLTPPPGPPGGLNEVIKAILT
ncbi:MAG TPA: tetratricopeptide repeat protein [Anaerolineae bacterium]|nr:tetratricopeptide repeat protein [Anaerolineae bacterium]HQK15668.1 tetratricopeptide repeat protein [Anaerolineae bacterium]